MAFCSNDHSVGDVGANCRFDFTLSFASLAFGILPASCWLVLSAVRSLCATTSRCTVSLRRWIRLAAAASLTLATILCCIRATDLGDDLFLAAAALNTISSAAVVWHTWMFGDAPSALLGFYLLVSSIFDAVRLRTLVLAGTMSEHRFLFGTFCLQFGFRTIFLFIENWPQKDAPFRTLAEMTLLWPVNLLLYRACRGTLSLRDLSFSFDDPRVLYEHWKCSWLQHHSLSKSLLLAFPDALLTPLGPTVLCGMSTVTMALLLRDFLEFINTPSESATKGYALAAAYAILYICSAFLRALSDFYIARLTLVLRTVLMQAVNNKTVHIHIAVNQDLGSGAISSFLSVDAERVARSAQLMYRFAIVLPQLAIGAAILASVQGLTTIAPIGILVIAMAAVPVASNLFNLDTCEWLRLSDRRSRLIASILQSIKAIKMSGYEGHFMTRYLLIRDTEMSAYKRWNWEKTKQGWLYVTAFELAKFTGIVPLAVRARHGGPAFDTISAYTTLAVIWASAGPYFELAWGYGNVVAALSSLRRIEVFLREQERPSLSLAPSEPEESTDKGRASGLVDLSRIRLHQASFGLKRKPFLHNISTTIPARKLTMIVGDVGSGKSALLAALLGELDVLAGSIDYLPQRPGSIAYSAQDPHILAGTIRENITLACNEVDEKRYSLTIELAALHNDIASFPQGDMHSAETLSGGQRARISLARCLYEVTDLFLFDDVLSSVDSDTEEVIFQNLFGCVGVLRGKTVIMVTNDPRRIRCADHIMHLEKGVLVDAGTFSELAGRDAAFSKLVQHVTTDNRLEEVPQLPPQKELCIPSGASAGIHYDSLDVEAGAMGDTGMLQALIAYVRAGGLWGILWVASEVLLGLSLSAAPNLYMTYWTSATDRVSSLAWIGGYVGLVAFHLFCVVPVGVTVVQTMQPVVALKYLHRQMTRGIFHAPLSFFHRHSAGLLVNRFSYDVSVSHTEWVYASIEVVNKTFMPVVALGFAVAQTAWAALIGGVIILVAFTFRRLYLPAAQQLRRLDHAYLTPVYTFAAQVSNPEGLRSIRAFGRQDLQLERSTAAIVNSNRPYLGQQLARAYLQLVLGLCIAPTASIIACIAVAQRQSTQKFLAASLFSLIGLTERFTSLVVSITNMDIASVAISRQLYLAHLDPEEVLSSGQDSRKKGEDTRWLQEGSVTFTNVSMRYDKSLPLAVQNVSFSIPSGSRVGICGRTGSGKTTLLSCLFRLFDCEEGEILISGRNITTVSRRNLRAAMCAIAQDPLLVDMSLRDNLALCEGLDDADIWAALERTRCKELVESLDGGLDHQVAANGGAFSRGTRQLFAITRALLQRPKLLVLDEASSSLDMQTDASIQRVLRQTFGRETTLLVVAHRISTIRDMDLILVMEGGRIVERGSPDILLQQAGSIFRHLAGES